jgi:hypothetical protein
MGDAGASECSAGGKLAVVWSVFAENDGGEVDVGAVVGDIGCDIALCLSESTIQGGKSDGEDEKEV